ncbi:hypothetical protein FQA39_LY16359 [Lamprigera yunnana]|nr:hypothetical protein FQA39_LY16359 [Lamprigera yunnana]
MVSNDNNSPVCDYRLDRKSSRGMLYENEELRLKTININAEVERGQSDIKKLKRENDQLRREIWYLRDEYDKLDKLLREKGSLCSSSSTTCSSDSESCSSFTEESEAVETSQNIENVNKTHLKKLNDNFDHLSMVQEENSGENSEKASNSNRASWIANVEKDVIKADQSYPAHQTEIQTPKHFFSPINVNRPNDDYVNNQFLGPDLPYAPPIYYDNPQITNEFVPFSYAMPVLDKTTTDVIVKTDNHNFNTINSHSSFSNGGNLEELLNDIETISQDILTISNSQNQLYQQSRQFASSPNFNEISEFSNSSYMQAPRVDNYEYIQEEIDKPYKSELNVVLMPAPMKLIEIEKYKNIQKSCESINNRSLESISASNNDLNVQSNLIIPPDQFSGTPQQPFVPVPPQCQHDQTNPFFFGNLPTMNEFVITQRSEQPQWGSKKLSQQKESEIYSSKANLLDTAVSSDHVSSENEENLKFKPQCSDSHESTVEKATEQKNEVKKSGLKSKVSIHFKGKKDKSKKEGMERKSLLSLKLPGETKDKKTLQKTPSVESKVSMSPNEPKTPNSTDSKTSTSDAKTSKNEPNSNGDKSLDKKSRKSNSASPERKHGKKIHKRPKKIDRSKAHRGSIGTDRYHRERSYSICTDRSNILDHRLGFYDDFVISDRERTNSLSSCETLKGRKLSVSHFPTGKIPWCGCWGNGCL